MQRAAAAYRDKALGVGSSCASEASHSTVSLLSLCFNSGGNSSCRGSYRGSIFSRENESCRAVAVGSRRAGPSMQ